LADKASINCHSSFLPDYKGGSVFKHVWSNHEKEAGATIHLLNKEFDRGRIISQSKLKIFKRDTPYTILYRLSEMTSVLLRESLLKIVLGFHGVSQSGGRYFYKKTNNYHISHYLINWFRFFIGLKPKLSPHKGEKID